MLQIKGISKVYKTGTLVQEALKNVSLSLRDCEFVAILGQSGSGKTTLLNILGGLDRYNSGDLIIDGVSTKKYSDRDWDSYRNHSVGFVFQSYNLIPHQTVLKNVELALTISGIGAGERVKRATEALEKVGLSEHIHKKPSQLSGGQMQRVAIARALVNDPKILLADEPTGALDSDTSLQVMDLLKEVAEDRLVVMVTHNPELAETYATRIVTLKDGEITSDSDPYEPKETESVHKNMGRSSMSLLTSLALSFNNLWTKKARTILVSFAGSIGIIGIAMILSMSNGANQYIRHIEEESLQEYPLEISESSINLTSMYTAGMMAAQEAVNTSNADSGEVREWSILTNLMGEVSSNDLKSLKAYFESDECDINDYVQAIEYDYNVNPYIFKINDKGDYRQVNPNESFASLGLSSTESNPLMSSLTSMKMNGDSFFAMPEKQELFEKDFDLKAGKWPEKYDECVLSLTASGGVSDLSLYLLGLKDPKELDDMIQSFVEGKSVKIESNGNVYTYDDFLGIEFKLLPSTSFYTYDKQYKVWSDRSSDEKYMKEKLKDAETLKIVGIIQPNADASSSVSEFIGIGYTASLKKHIIELASDTEIVKQQLAKPETNVFTGKRFDDEKKENSGMDLSKLFSVDSDAIGKLFDTESLTGSMDLSSLDLSGLDLSDMDLSSSVSTEDLGSLMPELDENTVKELLSGINLNMTESTMSDLFSKLLSGYQKYSADDKRTDISTLPSSLMQYLDTDSAHELIGGHIQKYIESHSGEMISEEDVAEIAEQYIAGYPLWLEKNGYDTNDFTHIADYVRSDDATKILSDGVEAMREKLKQFKPTDEEINSLTADIVKGYEAYADENGLPSASYILKSFQNYLGTDEAQKLITDTIGDIVDASGLEKSISKYSDIISAQIATVLESVVTSIGTEITSAIESSMTTLLSGLSDNLMSAFNFDTDAIAEMFKTNMSAEELRDLMISLLSTQQTNLDSNFRKMGYADLDKPASITIYPIDYDSKQHIKQLIDDYNRRMEASGEEDKIISYTDIVDALMSSVTTIVDVISYVLIAFVAVSLIVSSIMIGVITYISVLERRKEIGILRAIGASKRNISNVFNAETFIIGALAGIIGVVVTQLLIILGNMILHALTDQDINAILPLPAAIILVFLSIALTLIGGIIPSRKAAKSDPVAALRSE